MGETLKEVVESGIGERFFETLLHQVEFSAKQTKDHFGLGCLSHMVPYMLHGGDPLSFFKINDYSQRIREDFQRGGLFENLIKKYLLDNNNQLKLLLVPDSTIAAKDE